MMIKKLSDVSYSEVTPKELYLNRRRFLKGLGLAGGAAVAGKQLVHLAFPESRVVAGTKLNASRSPLSTTEKVTPYGDITTYNNFYEFGTEKGDPSNNAGTLKTKPWTVKVDGLVNKPADYQLEDLIKPYALEDRIYRHRCVEAWSLVIPWVGFPLASLLKTVEPKSTAKFVEF